MKRVEMRSNLRQNR